MNVALDHINFFSGQEEYIEAFKRFAALVPADGLLLAGIDSPNVASVAAAATSPVQTFGFAGDAEWQAANVRLEPERSVFDVLHRGQPYLRDVILAQPGRYVLLSALAAIALARHLGIAEQSVREALATFEGARRRLEMRGEVGGVTVVEDFAHHPTQARTSLRPPLFASRTGGCGASRPAHFQQPEPALPAGLRAGI